MKGAKTLSLFLSFVTLFSLTSCHDKTTINSTVFYDEYEDIKLSDSDNYRNYYEIFPYSFYDSDNDGFGDLNGITEKLDYVEEMGFNGIWLTPIHKSSTYHRYDVIDYYSIDDELGTMDDYRKLVNECHKRGIDVILDLVLNHSSDLCSWFEEGSKNFKNGGKYSDFYNFSLTYDETHKYLKNGVYYEAQFGSNMPDLNLDSENVKEEIKNIIDFYLLDIGIDGFRLDAVTSYYTNDHKKNIEFLSWLNEYSESVKEDVFIIGECWAPQGVVTDYYESGLDSFFAYNNNTLGYNLIPSIINNSPYTYFDYMEMLIEQAGENIPGLFITNHDNPRATTVLYAKEDDSDLKFGHGIMAMMTGTTFTYYGDEIGMMGSNKSGNDPKDENVRTHMEWGEKEGMPNNPNNAYTDPLVYGTVKDQMKNPSSSLFYIRKANRIRNKYEVIRKGNVEVLPCDIDQVGIIEKTYNNESVYIVFNFSRYSKEVNLSSLSFDETNYDYLLLNTKDKLSIKNKTTNIPSKGILILNKI